MSSCCVVLRWSLTVAIERQSTQDSARERTGSGGEVQAQSYRLSMQFGCQQIAQGSSGGTMGSQVARIYPAIYAGGA